MPSRLQRAIAPALAIALGTFLIAAPTRAEEPGTAETVRKLIPALSSKDAGRREDARRQILALGEEAREELRRISRGSDPTSAAAALALLDDRRWTAEPDDAAGDGLEGARKRVERVRELLGAENLERWRDLLGTQLHERLDLDLSPFLRGRAGTAGRVDENGRVFAWKRGADGAVSVTVRDGPDAEEKTYEAPSLEELRKQAPDVAKRLDELLQAEQGKGGLRISLRPGDLRVAIGPVLREFTSSQEHVREALGRMRLDLSRARSLTHRLRGLAPAKPLLGIEWTRPSAALRSHLELESGGLLVERVTAGTLAGRLGLRRHDVLVELAGRKVASAPDLREAIDTVEEGGTVKAVVLRKARRVELSTTR